jgi:hypothetical protein
MGWIIGIGLALVAVVAFVIVWAHSLKPGDMP